jgi:XTP/dITP diphosphohydrolase
VTLPPETGRDLRGERRAQGRVAAAEATGLPALADDSGLCVDALDGAPGVHSARYAGDGGDAANRAKLLAALRGVEGLGAGRALRLRARPRDAGRRGRVQVRGECRGVLLEVERGAGGFGYDPLFVPEGHARTFAEMTVAEKEPLSHRGRAIARARERFRPETAHP